MCTVERYVVVRVGRRVAHSFRSPIHQNIKETIVKSTERDTVHIFRTLHNTARVFKNKVSMEVVSIERRPGGAKFEDIRDLVSGQRGRLVYENGDKDYGIWSAGVTIGKSSIWLEEQNLRHNAGLINDIPTCKDLLARLEREVEGIVGGLTQVVTVKSKL